MGDVFFKSFEDVVEGVRLGEDIGGGVVFVFFGGDIVGWLYVSVC